MKTILILVLILLTINGFQYLDSDKLASIHQYEQCMQDSCNLIKESNDYQFQELDECYFQNEYCLKLQQEIEEYNDFDKKIPDALFTCLIQCGMPENKMVKKYQSCQFNCAFAQPIENEY